jgi:hypothetical protein
MCDFQYCHPIFWGACWFFRPKVALQEKSVVGFTQAQYHFESPFHSFQMEFPSQARRGIIFILS